MNNKKIVKLAIPGVVGAVTGGLAVGLIKVMTKGEVNRKTQRLEKEIQEIKELTQNTNRNFYRFKKQAEELEKTTIRSMSPDDLAKTLNKIKTSIVDSCTEAADKEIDSKVKQYSDYMMGQIDEAYERLEKAEEYIEAVGTEVLGDKAEKVIEKVFEEVQGEENVTNKIETNSDSLKGNGLKGSKKKGGAKKKTEEDKE